MPISFTFDADLKCAISTYSGVVDDAEILAHARRLVSDAAIPDGVTSLLDFRAVTEFRVTTDCIHEVVATIQEHPRFTKGAFVADDDLVFGMSRMYQMLREGSPVEHRVFRDLDEALAWLGL